MIQMAENYIGRIDSLEEEVNDGDIKEQIKCTMFKLLNIVNNIIPSFFSDKGEGKRIEDVYRTLKSGMIGMKKIQTIDLNKAMYIYDEYLDGLRFTMTKIITMDMVDKKKEDEIVTILNGATKKDNLFIQELFGGGLNKEVEISIAEAIGNLEALIDLIPKIKCQVSYIENTIMKELEINERNVTDSLEARRSGMYIDCVRLYTRSLEQFVFRAVRVVIHTYQNILNIMNGVAPEKETDTFALF